MTRFRPFPEATPRRRRGFTLTELTVVLVIVGLLLAGLLPTLGAQTDRQRTRETQAILDKTLEALLGFAAAHGRLPCPAVDGATGEEAPPGGDDCATFSGDFVGYVPGITLSIGPTDAKGYVLDAWGNRLRYAVTDANVRAFTNAGSVGNPNTLRTSWTAGLSPDIVVCPEADDITATTCGSAPSLTGNAAAILVSAGKNQQLPPRHAAETANIDDNRTFVSSLPLPANPPTDNGFDDLVVWLSPHTLYHRMIAAGRLP